MEKNLKIKEVSGVYHGFIEENLGTDRKCILRNTDVKLLIKEAQEDNLAFEFNVSFVSQKTIYPSSSSFLTSFKV